MLTEKLNLQPNMRVLDIGKPTQSQVLEKIFILQNFFFNMALKPFNICWIRTGSQKYLKTLNLS